MTGMGTNLIYFTSRIYVFNFCIHKIAWDEENCALVTRHASQTGNSFLTFQDNFSVLSSRAKTPEITLNRNDVLRMIVQKIRVAFKNIFLQNGEIY